MFTPTLFIGKCISDSQHGFMKGRSICTNLLTFTNYAIKVIESKSQLDVIYTDFSKAFDRIQHSILLRKLNRFGIHSNMLKWIESYLTGRTQQVKISTCLSRAFVVKSGVPQGSHLGPLLFILFINDIVDAFEHVTCMLYADDLKLYMKIKSTEDVSKLQSDMDRLAQWCSKNCLYLNVEKCFVSSYYRIKNPIMSTYSINSHILERKTVMKDLGVLFDTQLTFRDHYDYIISKSYSMLSFLKRTCKEMNNVYALRSVYCAFVRSTLEFASIVWNPYYDIHCKRIESIQKQFMLYALRKLGWRNRLELPSYRSRCLLINLELLSDRRRNACIFFVYDLLSDHIDSSHLLSLLKISIPTRTSSRNYDPLLIDRHRTKYGTFEPMTNMCRTFNSAKHLFDFNVSRSMFRDSCKKNL